MLVSGGGSTVEILWITVIINVIISSKLLVSVTGTEPNWQVLGRLQSLPPMIFYLVDVDCYPYAGFLQWYHWWSHNPWTHQYCVSNVLSQPVPQPHPYYLPCTPPQFIPPLSRCIWIVYIIFCILCSIWCWVELKGVMVFATWVFLVIFPQVLEFQKDYHWDMYD